MRRRLVDCLEREGDFDEFAGEGHGLKFQFF